jgi:hypothetical protein
MGLTRLDGSVEAQLKLEAAARFCSFHDTNFERSGRVSHVGGMTLAKSGRIRTASPVFKY